ncbi:MAG TPA: bifunctional DNA-formamidopyrimidine glycosylase/DNA-(apurinic or apyrimidinic site) lyase [Thermomicrobiaceae bacterium]|nr:bifunctional DNA-formamidopyrimidine glycosylase/DNA-(apurinic or apyrimidinic site) lyase [Thermomicrobiaceae bacterium]
MPELPEVETVRRGLAEAISGATIEDLRVGAFSGSLAGITPEALRAEIVGEQIVDVGRRAKYLLLALSNGRTIAIHLRMTGELKVARPEEPSGKHHHLTFVLAGGRELRFRDIRKFGRIRLLDAAELAALDAALGPEPLASELTPAAFHARLQGHRRAIKPLLLEQHFLAGVGNIYADEALFASGIHPLRPANSLTPEEAGRLLESIRAVLSGAIERRGTTLRNYRDGFGQAGGNQFHLQIYTRAEGEPCPRCGSPVQRLVVGQRGTKLCPRCQPL